MLERVSLFIVIAFVILFQIVKEKERFKQNPYNYAMKKTELMKDRDMAVSRYVVFYFSCQFIYYFLHSQNSITC